MPAAPSRLLKFVLGILSDPRYSSIIAWEGTNCQFTIIQPDELSSLWGQRNDRKNMTYQKFTRVLRYYYHKNVLIKVRGRKYTYKFNIPELQKQYGYEGIMFSHTTIESSGNSSSEIPVTSERFYCPFTGYNFPAVDVSFSICASTTHMPQTPVPSERQDLSSSFNSYGDYFSYRFYS